MATTWMKALHRTTGNSIAAALDRSTNYVENPNKTNGGELIESYECNAHTAQAEFLFAKRQYMQTTGRDQGKHDVIAYHIRQSFKPGEVTPEEALAIGKELALRFTRGRHQFIIAAHVNTNNPHVHIIFNSVNLDCNGKFQDFKRSAMALRRLSDIICLEHGLPVIENPEPSRGHYRSNSQGDDKPLSVRDKLRALIDESLLVGDTFETFLAKMMAVGCEVKQGKHLAFKIPDGVRFIRCYSLGDDYTESAVRERLSGKQIVATKQEEPTEMPVLTTAEDKPKPIVTPSTKQSTPPATISSATPSTQIKKPSLLIDIQAKIEEGRGKGYEQWARVFNLKQAAKTLIFLQEQGIDGYDDLVEKAATASSDFSALTAKIKGVEKRLSEISELQRHIGTYGKTLDVYAQYRASGKSESFYESHRADIALHLAAKKYFDSLGLKKLPTMQSLKQEYATLLAEQKRLYSGYHAAKENMMAMMTAKDNVRRILGLTEKECAQESLRTKPRRDNPDR